jgi:pyruvate, orthophosphate dikinase
MIADLKEHIYFYSAKEFTSDDAVLGRIGIRGRLAMELSSLGLPTLPGFVIESEAASKLEDMDLEPVLREAFPRLEKKVGRVYGDPQNPMLVKIVISPNLVIASYPLLHDFGLTDETFDGFCAGVGRNFGVNELQFLLRGMLEIEARIAGFEKKDKLAADIRAAMEQLPREMQAQKDLDKRKAAVEKCYRFLPKGFRSGPYNQLALALKRIALMLRLDDMDQDDTAILVQPMVYGNYGKDAMSGNFFTRDIVTGENRLQGNFSVNKFDEIGTEGRDINKIGKAYLQQLERSARKLEDHYREIRTVRFNVENKKLWLYDQYPALAKSAQSEIRTIIDLFNRKIIDDREVVRRIKPGQLNEILHSIMDKRSVTSMKRSVGGITGAPGAAIGRVYFTTEKLLDAHKLAMQKGLDTRMVLCMPATYAGDVKAIEVATGVLSNEGGYSAHASVVARQYGKVSLVKTDMKIRGDSAIIGAVTVKEGDYLTLNVPYYGEPEVYFGKATLIEPSPEQSGLLEFLEIVKKHVHHFHVRANGDTPRDAVLAKTFGARGIGLCRTEHMFFDSKRINVFREMVLADTKVEREKALRKLQPMQRGDFEKLFETMSPYPVTIRLLDPPLHEFLPRNEAEMKAFLAYLRSQKFKLSPAEVRARCEALEEANPMLGHRGCRLAVSYPEIYEMQVRAIFEAVYALQKKGVEVHPEVMVPIVMNQTELRLIVYGKKIEGASIRGLVDVEREVRQSMKARPVPYMIGTMIELPAAALGAGEIAQYAQFFSFGTNDLSQTTLGLSRDDFNNFMPDYSQFDILKGNPFRFLDDAVKQLIEIGVSRGRLTRPDLEAGLCGEHGAVPENIRFCMEAGLDYVSCSAYSVPIAQLAIAQINVEKGDAA